MKFAIMATLVLSFTTVATTINDKPSLGLSYSYLWDYSNTFKYFDTHMVSIYGGLPIIKERVNIGLEAGIEIPFKKNTAIIDHTKICILDQIQIFIWQNITNIPLKS
jgi:hypothetical protein